MAKKKNITDTKLISFYMDYVLTHNHAPKTVYAFAKDNNFDEADFYKNYASFDALEKSIFKVFFYNSIEILEKSEEYQHFDARNKLLSFYFTFFENLTANRSYVVYALKDKGMKSLSSLSELRHAFKKYIDMLDIETLDIKEPRIVKIQDFSKQESFWIQFMMIMKFWLDDTSPSFEKTDIFIEKSVHAGFDLMDIKPLKSVIDLGKFIFKEKMQ
ncbi:TetR family transcriptional regulator C-terminal domain-containing protein [Bizionia myxarmorum]|uniref:TetR/AcrR family transcriptional regulator n=1 Tax=Bizionia myxarmorum TaxID=291186 RepID=A0A5D0QYR5_9FLAO|nr:TetR family transcriptional regulator C-terminal domain-containing protein [Bizionia myxarmorum]TYB74340.1 TetR/AcrR family transcriptional regulator [Bizionia myxarmorum]